MRRRDLIAGALFAITVGRAQAQQAAMVYRIAIVTPALPIVEVSETGGLLYYRAFFEELRRLGFVEGQNLVVERYSGEGRTEHYPDLAREVVRLNPDLILAATPGLTLAFKTATATIPIVTLTQDPVAFGIVPSMARPGGNITGVSIDAGLELWGKRLELLKQTVPTASRVGYLATRERWASPEGAALREAAVSISVSLIGPPLDSMIGEAEFRRVIAAMARDGADGLIVSTEAGILPNRRLIVELAEKGRLPAIYPFREAVEVGGLVAYAFDFPEAMRHQAGQIDQILRGTNPGDIPFYQVTRFELIINLKTAKALGLTIPPAVLARVDEVIE